MYFSFQKDFKHLTSCRNYKCYINVVSVVFHQWHSSKTGTKKRCVRGGCWGQTCTTGLCFLEQTMRQRSNLMWSFLIVNSKFLVSNFKHYIWIVSNVHLFWINLLQAYIQMPLCLAALAGVECCWLSNWDTDKKLKKPLLHYRIYTQRHMIQFQMMQRAIKSKTNTEEGGLCLFLKHKVYLDLKEHMRWENSSLMWQEHQIVLLKLHTCT